MLLCSRPALHCRDNHSMYKAMNDDQIVRLCLWHSRSALLYHKAGGSQCLTGERAAKQETLVGSVSWDWVYFNILSHAAHMLSFFFLTHSVLRWTQIIHPSIMWMLCRPVFSRSSVHPNAATVPTCCPYCFFYLKMNIPIASTSWWFNKKVND